MFQPSYGLKQPSEYRDLSFILNDVSRNVIAINKATRKRARSHAEQVLSEIVGLLKQGDETFNQVYNGVRHVGSYHEGLKITEPNRFEKYIVLKFPFSKRCKISNSELGCVQVCVKEGWNSSFSEPQRRSLNWTLKKIVNKEGFVCPNQVLQWWQSIFSKSVDPAGRTVLNNRKAKWTTRGQAVTVRIKAGDYPSPIVIVLVPVIRFKDNDGDDFFIFPKRSFEVSQEPQLQWRLSYPDQEKAILKDKNNLKHGTRLLKRLRDKYKWGPLTSYIIKTIALHECHKGKDFFQNNLGFIFLQLLSSLRECVRNRDLRFYWDNQLNIMNEIKFETSDCITNFIENIWDEIHSLIRSRDQGKLDRYVRGLFLDPGSNEVVPDGGSARGITSSTGASGTGHFRLVLHKDEQEQQEESGGLFTNENLFKVVNGVNTMASIYSAASCFLNNRSSRTMEQEQKKESGGLFQPKYLAAAALGIGAIAGASYMYNQGSTEDETETGKRSNKKKEGSFHY